VSARDPAQTPPPQIKSVFKHLVQRNIKVSCFNERFDFRYEKGNMRTYNLEQLQFLVWNSVQPFSFSHIGKKALVSDKFSFTLRGKFNAWRQHLRCARCLRSAEGICLLAVFLRLFCLIGWQNRRRCSWRRSLLVTKLYVRWMDTNEQWLINKRKHCDMQPRAFFPYIYI